MIEITTRQEYDYAISKGRNPLLNWRMFKMNHQLRIDIQHELFGAGSFQTENQKFYEYMWANSIHCCVETGVPIENYSAVHISHILGKGSDRRMACDPRNVNILTRRVHNIWDNGTIEDKIKLNIYRENQIITNFLKKEYNYEKINI